ncbi:carbonate dehydratase [Kangiella geojedonensis]|uniref:Carbonic anhydrase n=1 Tax=Kangiella geojedonensis TaxID=914150 RepID=A0A0F6TS77_9GAMM|nr:carbonate dehydratase [Kangiella geojedonensis]AKE53015.1 Carbonic anhydrase [Kangiella geojedonensis]
MSDIKKLLEQNRQWAADTVEQYPDFFKELSEQQSPKYLWIGCADSRVPATQITNLMPGEIFVHRNIANQVSTTDLNCMSVLQFAVQVLQVEHIIVCGHYGCGGVNAALSNQQLGLIDNWLTQIKDVYIKNETKFTAITNEQERSDLMCELNVKDQVQTVCNTTIVQDAWKRGQKLSVHGWCYSLKDGHIKDLEVSTDSVSSNHSVYQYQS